MKEELHKIRTEATILINEINDLKSLEEVRVKLLGKKGDLTQILRNMNKLSNEEKPIIGQVVNEVRIFIETELGYKKDILMNEEENRKINLEKLDVTIKGTHIPIGNKHPMTKIIDEIKDIFIGLGFEIAEGPDVETDYYNFEALNIPPNHPAKDEQDTFYVEGGFVLRTQTSPVQVRTMEKGEMPIKIIAPGRVFRSDAVDATHSPVFHQLEGLVIDKGISMAHLKGSLSLFAKQLFGEQTKTRFRPHHFPFTEPSAEMDVSCFGCHGQGCRICKNSGWIEILGCGMVHPKVLEMSKIDINIYSGFAFGMGLERIAMQKYGITDLRLMYENDVNFIKQF